MDIFEIYDEGFNGCKRLLKNGKAINEFGMLKEVKKRDREIAKLEAIIENGLGPEDLHQDSLQSHIN